MVRYVQEVIARLDVRWIECACASLSWTALITYHLGEPYGHLMNSTMQGPERRVAARGNVTSFLMPWEDILRNVQHAAEGSTKVPLPHDGAVLAALLHVHIVGNSLDVSKHLREVHIRPHVVRMLLEELIQRGFPGYGAYSVDGVRQRVRAL